MAPQTERQEDSDDSGFALLAVLGFILLFAMFLAPFAASSRLKALTVGHEYNRARLGNAVEAINGYIAWRLSADPRWRGAVDGGGLFSSECAIKDVSMKIAIIPHASLINLNTAEEPLLVSGLKGIGLIGIDAQDTAQKVMWFRSPGTSNGDDRGIVGGPKHAPFEDISELHDFEALRGVALADLGHVFSVREGRAILSRSKETGGASMFYTIETVLFDGDDWTGSASVFSAATRSGPSQKVATNDVDTKPPMPKSKGNCASLLDGDVTRVLEEVLA